MRELGEINESVNKNVSRDLLKNYAASLNDPDFAALVHKIKVNEDLAMKYTSKIKDSVIELNNCKGCKGLNCCKNKSHGYVTYPRVDGRVLQFDSIACKYMQKSLKDDASHVKSFEEPYAIKMASMKGIDITDKTRVSVIKWINKFCKNYKSGNKGLYLHGSFGSGKSYMIAALFNELVKDGHEAIIVYFPEMLRTLKASFNTDFDSRMDELKTCELLLLDDIGAEAVTAWSRDEILGTILQYRMDQGLTTFFTSNLNIEELETHLSETKNNIDILKARRIIERIKQLTEDMELISKNRRV